MYAKKIRREIEDLNTINELALINIYKMLCPTTANCTFLYLKVADITGIYHKLVNKEGLQMLQVKITEYGFLTTLE